VFDVTNVPNITFGTFTTSITVDALKQILYILIYFCDLGERNFVSVEKRSIGNCVLCAKLGKTGDVFTA